MDLLYYKNVDFQDTGGTYSTIKLKIKKITRLELNIDCSLKYTSARTVHNSLHIDLLQQSDSTLPSLTNASSRCQILFCVTYFLEWQIHKSHLRALQMFVAETTELGLT